MAVISHSKKFIFIHNYKVAGTSLRAALTPYEPFYLRNKYSHYIKHKLFMRPHIKAHELRQRIPKEIFNSYFKFGFVRNPWDWQVSLYEYMRQDKHHFQHELACSFKDFKEYLKWRVHEDLHLQKEFFYAPDGEYLVNKIYKFEELSEAIADLNKTLGLSMSLPHKNKSQRKDMSAYYDAEASQMIEQAFADDIKLFNYERPILRAAS